MAYINQEIYLRSVAILSGISWRHKERNIPMSVNARPELDDSPFLDKDKHKLFQQIIGTCQWLIVCGRIDISYAVTSLSRFSVAPRELHLQLAQKIYGYLKKYPKRGYIIKPESPKINIEYTKETFSKDFGS